ncbi:MAG: hypothetical protein JO168_05610 [Solirubrobacterales bacterium]|nr:hypothetical protein [Solirubrobacterales bacterium]
MTLPAAPGAVQRSTRDGIVVLLALAVLNAGFLYFLSGHAATGYAWAIRPPISAAFLGAGYLAGVVATALAVFAARHWRSIQPLAVALVTLSLALLTATLLHTDRFRWGYPPTWAWTGVYALAPFGVAILARRQRNATIRPGAADPRLRLLRALSLVFGTAMLAAAIALFAFPTELGRYWPWPLTALLAQAIAAWIAMIGAALLWSAYDLRSTDEAIIPYATLGAWCVALLALPALHSGDLTRTGTALEIYVAALIALLALAVLGVTRAGDRARL